MKEWVLYAGSEEVYAGTYHDVVSHVRTNARTLPRDDLSMRARVTVQPDPMTCASLRSMYEHAPRRITVPFGRRGLTRR